MKKALIALLLLAVLGAGIWFGADYIKDHIQGGQTDASGQNQLEKQMETTTTEPSNAPSTTAAPTTTTTIPSTTARQVTTTARQTTTTRRATTTQRITTTQRSTTTTISATTTRAAAPSGVDAVFARSDDFYYVSLLGDSKISGMWNSMDKSTYGNNGPKPPYKCRFSCWNVVVSFAYNANGFTAEVSDGNKGINLTQKGTRVKEAKDLLNKYSPLNYSKADKEEYGITQ